MAALNIREEIDHQVALDSAYRVVDAIRSWLSDYGWVHIDLGVDKKTAAIIVDWIFVDQADRGSGHGQKALSYLCQLADKYAVPLELEVGGGETDTSWLLRWYASHGFTFVPGENYLRRDPR